MLSESFGILQLPSSTAVKAISSSPADSVLSFLLPKVKSCHFSHCGGEPPFPHLPALPPHLFFTSSSSVI